MNSTLKEAFDFCKNSKKNTLVIYIIDKRECQKWGLSKKICDTAFDEKSKNWLLSQFIKKPKIIVEKLKVLQNSTYLLNSEKVNTFNDVGNSIYIVNTPIKFLCHNKMKYTAFIPDITIYKLVYTKILKNWQIDLILEKYSNKKTLPDWDNYDKLTIKYIFLKKPKNLTITDLNVFKSSYSTLLKTKRGGSNEHITSNINYPDGKTYVISSISNIAKKQFKFLSDLFIHPSLLNRTNYFNNILHNISNFQICTIPTGIEYIIVIDKHKIYYISLSHIYDEPNSISSSTLGGTFSVISAVKKLNKFTIRTVIISDGKYLKENDNKLNKKFGEKLNMEYTIYYDLTNISYKKQIRTCTELKMNHILEFTQKNTSFYDNSINQWSRHPLEITFLAKKCPSDFINKYNDFRKGLTKNTINKNDTLYLLYLTSNRKYDKYINTEPIEETKQLFSQQSSFFYPKHFAPSTNPMAFLFWSPLNLVDTYINLVWKDGWEFVSKSHKSQTFLFGDDYKYVELNTWNQFRNPVALKDLVLDQNDVKSQMYFPFLKKKKTYEHVVKYNSFVKGVLINSNIVSDAIDMASGKGQDLIRYYNSNIKKLLMIEIDKDAIDTLLERKYSIYNNKGIAVNVLNANLNDSYKINLEKIKLFEKEKTSQIFCHLALHYLTDTKPRIKNIVTLISSLLKPGSEFLYTSFNRKKVMELLGKSGKWEHYEGKFRKYSIIKTGPYSIKLIIPVNPDKYYTETLIDDDTLDKEFKKCGMSVKKQGSFIDFINEFKIQKPQLFKDINSYDEKFISLYSYKSYIKN